MLGMITGFIILINPFALYIYLNPVMEKLSNRDFVKVLTKASLISTAIYIVFMLVGDFLFSKVFRINFDSFRIFGGIVLFSFSYFYIVKGQKALLDIKEDLNDLASEIALPFMVGAGTISLSILIGENWDYITGTLMISGSVAVSVAVILILKTIKDKLNPPKIKVAFDKNMEVLIRLNGFFVGAIGIDMIITGINNIYFVSK